MPHGPVLENRNPATWAPQGRKPLAYHHIAPITQLNGLCVMRTSAPLDALPGPAGPCSGGAVTFLGTQGHTPSFGTPQAEQGCAAGPCRAARQSMAGRQGCDGAQGRAGLGTAWPESVLGHSYVSGYSHPESSEVGHMPQCQSSWRRNCTKAGFGAVRP